ncbi:MAG TPA: MFS transporter [bacterium]|nr:MFS transporter [bacterium]
MAQWQKNLYALWAAQFVSMIGLTLVVPFMPLYIGTLGVHRLEDVERWSGVLFAAPFLTQTLIAPLWGVLGDRYGRKIMVIRALTGIGFTNMLAAAVGAVWQLLALRVVQGGVSGFVAATNALVSSSIPRDRLGTAMGVLQSSLTAGGIIGPLIGGALADAIGFRGVFVITGLMCWGGTAVVLIATKEAARSPAREGGPGVRDNLAYFLGSPALRPVGLLLCTSNLAVMAVEPIFPVFVQTLGVPVPRVATVAGVLFSVTGFASMAGAAMWGRISDRLGEGRVLTMVLWGACVAYAAQAAVRGPVTLFILRAALGLAVGGLMPPLYAIVARRAPAERLGGIMGLTSSAIMIGNLVGPIAGGMFAAAAGIRPVFVASAAALGVAALATRGLVPAIAEPAPAPGAE